MHRPANLDTFLKGYMMDVISWDAPRLYFVHKFSATFYLHLYKIAGHFHYLAGNTVLTSGKKLDCPAKSRTVGRPVCVTVCSNSASNHSLDFSLSYFHQSHVYVVDMLLIL